MVKEENIVELSKLCQRNIKDNEVKKKAMEALEDYKQISAYIIARTPKNQKNNALLQITTDNNPRKEEEEVDAYEMECRRRRDAKSVQYRGGRLGNMTGMMNFHAKNKQNQKYTMPW